LLGAGIVRVHLLDAVAVAVVGKAPAGEGGALIGTGSAHQQSGRHPVLRIIRLNIGLPALDPAGHVAVFVIRVAVAVGLASYRQAGHCVDVLRVPVGVADVGVAGDRRRGWAVSPRIGQDADG
jgi:hypothetical protein